MIRLAQLFLFTSFISGASASTSTLDCESRLHTTVVQLTKIAYQAKLLNLVEIAAVANSADPIDPVLHKVANSESAYLKRVMADNLRQLPREKWPQVRTDLHAFIAAENRKAGTIETAKVATQNLFIPKVSASFGKGVFSQDHAFVYTNREGHLISVFVANAGGRGSAKTFLETTDLTAGSETERTLLGQYFSTAFSAFVTPEKNLRLAILHKPGEIKIIAYPDAENSFTLPLAPSGRTGEKPDSADAAPSNWIVAKNGHTYLAVTDHASVQVFDLSTRGSPIFNQPNLWEFSRPHIFESAKGQLFLSFTDREKHLFVYLLNGERPRRLMDVTETGIVNSANFWEAEDGNVYLSVNTGGRYKVYRPLIDDSVYFKNLLLLPVIPKTFGTAMIGATI